MTTNDAPFRFTPEGNTSVLQLLPELNNVQWGEIDAIGTSVLSSMESQSHPHIIVDLSPLNYMGSAMVALIVRVWKAAQAKKGKICVVCPHPGVKEVLKLAALDKVWSIVDNMNDARSNFGLGRNSGSLNAGSSSKGAGIWIIGVILLVACGALVAFAVNPGWLGLKNEKPASADQASSEGDESSSTDNAKISFEAEGNAADDLTTMLEAKEPAAEKKQAEAKSPENEKTTTEKPAPKKEEAKPSPKPEAEKKSESKPKPKPASEPKTK